MATKAGGYMKESCSERQLGYEGSVGAEEQEHAEQRGS